MGFLGLCPVLVLLRFVAEDTFVEKAFLCVLLALIGFGITLTLDPLLAEIFYIVEKKAEDQPQLAKAGTGLYGQAYALFNMAWSVGNIVGPIWTNAVEETAGWSTMGWSLGVLSAVTANSSNFVLWKIG
jgi:MFS family permease